MPGFYISDFSRPVLRNRYDERCVSSTLDACGFYCSRNTLDRFMNDKLFCEDDSYILICEGVILNKSELFASCSTNDLHDLVVKLYKQEGETYFSNFRGSFSGALYDKDLRRWVVYTNHYGDKPLFYYKCEQGFAIGSQVNYILAAMRENNLPVDIDKNAIYKLLTYGFMNDDATPCSAIKRLLPGHYAIIDDTGINVHEYWRPKANKLNLTKLSEDQLIEGLDEKFRNAVKREFDKDVEYGYKHLCDLSGGLDSRMTTWVARDLGYGPFLNITYSQSGYLDEKIAANIAADLENEFMFKSLDDAGFMYEPEEATTMNYGLSPYFALTGGNSMLRNLATVPYGMEHTGQIGDVVIGTFVRKLNRASEITHSGMYSSMLADKLPAIESELFEDAEQYLLMTRAFLGACASHLIRSNYTEIASPFLDVDLMEYCFSIPVENRFNHSLYKKWIKTKYPKAATYVWEKEGVPLTARNTSIKLKKLRKKIKIHAHRAIPALAAKDKHGMNPFDYWYATVPGLSVFLETTLERVFGVVPYADLRADMQRLYENGTAIEKAMAVSAGVAVEYYLSYGGETDC
jgi:asparagine synthase (glutamine-hydrolysing)